MNLERPLKNRLQRYAPLMVALCLSAMVGGTAQAHVFQGVRVTEVTEASHPFSTWHCARQPILVRMIGPLMEIVFRGDSRILQQAVSASGARYVAPGDPGTEFWGKGSQAAVKWSGTTLPVCTEEGALMVPMRASGNEPFWAVDFDGWRLSLSQPGQPVRDFDVKGQMPRAGGWRLHAESGQAALNLDISQDVCVDSMTGQPHPYTVRLNMNEVSLPGCGGDPARLLQGVRWRLTALGGQAVTIPATLEFLPDNRLAGSNGCNRLIGSYAVSGEGLSFSQLGSTRMACELKVMTQADAFDRYLSSVHGFAFDEHGALVLKAEQGELLLQASEAVEN